MRTLRLAASVSARAANIDGVTAGASQAQMSAVAPKTWAPKTWRAEPRSERILPPVELWFLRQMAHLAFIYPISKGAAGSRLTVGWLAVGVRA